MKKIAFLSLAMLISACNNESQRSSLSFPDTDAKNTIFEETPKLLIKQTTSTLSADQFNSSAMIKPAETVSCTLEDSTESTCMKFVVKYQPDNLNVGPFCPQNLDEAGGVWNWDGENAGLYRIDSGFLKMLNDLGYTFYDDNGDVYVTDDKPEKNNTCINMQANKKVELTLLIPTQPKQAKAVTRLGTVAKVGFSTQGVPVFADAPSVLQTGHMPALDVCGGHIDPGGWYHLHAVSNDVNSVYDKLKVDANCALEQQPSALFAYAFDGYAIYGRQEADGSTPENLDECHGHIGSTVESDSDIYHYHSSDSFPNLPPCLTGVSAEANFSTTAAKGAGGQGARNRSENGHQGQNTKRTPPGFTEAAKKLGVTEEAFFKAMTDAGGRNADIKDVAEALGVTEEKLRSILPKPPTK